MHLLNHLACSAFIPVSALEFLKAFPLRELIARGYLPPGAGLRELAAFFGVRPGELFASTRYRHSAAFKSCPYALAAWRRAGELEARQVLCARYRTPRFRTVLQEIRALTREPIADALPQIVVQCASAGVAVVMVPEFKGCAVSGASGFLSPGKAMIQLSLRYKRDDQFFFSFFHEAGHLLQDNRNQIQFRPARQSRNASRSTGTLAPRPLLPSVQSIQQEQAERAEASGNSSHAEKEQADCGTAFGNGVSSIGEDRCESVDQESESLADAFARDLLIPPEVAGELPGLKTPEAVEAFARRMGIAPGIVVGRLQHDGLVPWNRREMADLKRVMDLSFLEQGQQGMWATWLSVTEAAGHLLHDLPQLDGELLRARARVSEAAGRGAFVTNCRGGARRRIEPASFAAWRLRQRDRDLDAEDQAA